MNSGPSPARLPRFSFARTEWTAARGPLLSVAGRVSGRTANSHGRVQYGLAPLGRLTAVFSVARCGLMLASNGATPRSEEHTSELQSHSDLVCRLLLEK